MEISDWILNFIPALAIEIYMAHSYLGYDYFDTLQIETLFKTINFNFYVK